MGKCPDPRLGRRYFTRWGCGLGIFIVGVAVLSQQRVQKKSRLVVFGCSEVLVAGKPSPGNATLDVNGARPSLSDLAHQFK